ncbi:MAG: glycosyltransferase family protein [Pseudobdellovibrionaceae bacterium]
MLKTKKILFYSHDTFGLGHIRRTQKIANSVARNDRSILIACASPKASSFASQSGIEYLNLPGFTKQISGEYSHRSLNIPIDQFVNLRSSLLLSSVRSFNPDLVIIDKEPLGVKKELLPSLEYLRQHSKNTRIICGFRDILDEKEAVADEWSRRGTAEALERYFDHILIYGKKSIFDFASEYELSPALSQKLEYTGYIAPDMSSHFGEFHFKFKNSNPVVTFTLGGGGDGWEFLETFIELLEKGLHRKGPPYNVFILTGPFAKPELIRKVREMGQSADDIQALDFTPDAASAFLQSQMIVSMGGYNTVIELCAMNKFPLILPRTVPRKEQIIRAEHFKQSGFCDYLSPEKVKAEILGKKIAEHLAKAASLKVPEFNTEGLQVIQNLFDQWLKK